MRKVKAIIERAGDGTYSVYMDADNMSYLITGTGNNAEEAINSFMTNYDDMKRYYADEGKEFEEVEFAYEYDMASFLSYYSKAFSLAGLSRITGVNQGQLSHYVTGHRTPSERTKLKIQNSIQAFAKELRSGGNVPPEEIAGKVERFRVLEGKRQTVFGTTPTML